MEKLSVTIQVAVILVESPCSDSTAQCITIFNLKNFYCFLGCWITIPGAFPPGPWGLLSCCGKGFSWATLTASALKSALPFVTTPDTTTFWSEALKVRNGEENYLLCSLMQLCRGFIKVLNRRATEFDTRAKNWNIVVRMCFPAFWSCRQWLSTTKKR